LGERDDNERLSARDGVVFHERDRAGRIRHYDDGPA
jgi:hypothetical protein